MAKAIPRKLKILCLHGHHQNAARFREKTGGFRKGLQSQAEFTFIDSPIQEGLEPPAEGSEETQTWFTTSPERTYWREKITGIYDGSFEKSVDFLRSFIKENGPFDGILSFSQGAAFSHAILCQGEWNLKFIIYCCGFIAYNASRNVKKETITGIRTFHCINKDDKVIPNDLSEELASVFDDPKAIVKHYECGHCIPPIKLCKSDLIEFFNEIRNQISNEEENGTA
ncbi:unnamed protein product [Bursaphelenchus xylophilus]|uniref:(pine wood nematode) hypothetical protein n=1 Tax=Bursaphelenchus xylophilus TaxID=6326 RepID=A0A1I7S081_BURXY|nr:unnamed protein product [Bursaphelenchus xylophilus]CAG9108952.1 unnamed protein product [Bursaphelenchus xylophilus]